MVEQVGRPNVSVIIAPQDPRISPLQTNSAHPEWTVDLYKEITEAFSRYNRKPKPSPA